MTPDEVASLLKGKVVERVKHHSYLHFGMCVSEIIFTDGTVIELDGHADEGIFSAIKLPGGEWEQIGNDTYISR